MPNEIINYHSPHSPKKGLSRKAGMTAVLGFAMATSAFAFTTTSANAATPAPSASASATPSVVTKENSQDMKKAYWGSGGIDSSVTCHLVDGKNDGSWDIKWRVTNGWNVPATVTTSSNTTLVPVDTTKFGENGSPTGVKDFIENVLAANKNSSHALTLKLDPDGSDEKAREISDSIRIDLKCPVPPVQITTLTCAAGLTVNLTGYPVRENGDDDRNGARRNHVTVTVDGIVPPVKDQDFDATFAYASGQLLPVFASHTARVVVDAIESEWSFDRQLSITCPAPVTNTVTVPGANTTTTVTVPGPTVTVSASPAPTVTAVPIAIVPAPATSPIAEPVPISLTPEAGTAPTSVNAGGGSSAPDSTLPLWAVALLATGALGAAGAGARLATSRKDSQE